MIPAALLDCSANAVKAWLLYAHDPGLTSQQLAASLGASLSTAQRATSELLDAGLVDREFVYAPGGISGRRLPSLIKVRVNVTSDFHSPNMDGMSDSHPTDVNVTSDFHSLSIDRSSQQIDRSTELLRNSVLRVPSGHTVPQEGGSMPYDFFDTPQDEDSTPTAELRRRRSKSAKSKALAAKKVARDQRPTSEWTVWEIAQYWKTEATRTFPTLWSSAGSVKNLATILAKRQREHTGETAEVQVTLIRMFLADETARRRVGEGTSLLSALLGYMGRNVVKAMDLGGNAPQEAVVPVEDTSEAEQVNARAERQFAAMFGAGGPPDPVVLTSVTPAAHRDDR